MQLRPGLIGEEIDGEVVMIDLGSGVYYSLRGGSVPVWRMLNAGTSRTALREALSDIYDADAPVIDAAFDELLAAMSGDGLIVEEAGEASALAHDLGQRRPFEAFEYERFDDMAHVIQLDPVHDIDPARGWPLAAD